MFFDKLKALCDQKGISTYKASTDVGLNRAAVAKWKKGSQPNGATVIKFAEYFGVSANYFLNEKDAPVTMDKRANSSSINLSKDELELIQKYRVLDHRGKSAVMNILNHEYTALRGGTSASRKQA